MVGVGLVRIPGYCTGCRRVRTVSVSGHGLAMAGRGVAQGICADCQQREDDQRDAERLTRGLLGKPVLLKMWNGPDVTGVLARVRDGQLTIADAGRSTQPPIPIRSVRHVVRGRPA